MPKKTIGLDNTFSIPSYDISDETANIKARRCLNQLKLLTDGLDPKIYRKLTGIRSDGTPKKRWQSVLDVPKVSPDSLYIFYGADKKQLPTGQTKGVHHAVIFTLFAQIVDLTEPGMKKGLAEELERSIQMGLSSPGTTLDDYLEDPEVQKKGDVYDMGLWLAAFQYQRSRVLRPRYGDEQPMLVPLVQITLHAIQRMFQRGYGLTNNGQMSFRQLKDNLMYLSLHALQFFQSSPDKDTCKVSVRGGRFVFKRVASLSPKNKDDKFIKLVTILPESDSATDVSEISFSQ